MRRSHGYDFRDIDGRFDKAGLALLDWQPSLWKRKQKLNKQWEMVTVEEKQSCVTGPCNFGTISAKMC